METHLSPPVVLSPGSITSCPDFPMLSKSLHTWSPRVCIHPRGQLAETQGNTVLHVSQYEHFWKLFILWKLLAFYLGSEVLLFITSITKMFLWPTFIVWSFSVLVSWTLKSLPIWKGRSEEIFRWAEVFTSMVTTTCRKTVLSWSGSYTSQLMAMHKGKAFTSIQWPQTYGRPIYTRCTNQNSCY